MENRLQYQRLLNFLIVLLALICSSTAGLAQEAEVEYTAEQLQFFENHVRPVLAEKCYSCHSAEPSERLEGDLMVDSRKDILRGGESGDPCVVPGSLEKSTLIAAIKWEDYEMPPSGQLPAKDIAAIEKWVKMGAPWPKEDTAGREREVFDIAKRKSEHWVWQPLNKTKTPSVKDTAWPKADLDHFVLADLEAADLSPADPADRLALMRRLHFDLIGLPPTPTEVEHFMANDSPQAMPDLVDRLLASPHFGERWGRHWLDLVRYAESRGHEFDNDIPNAFQYRDYIIRAFNAGVPYDQLIREHIAGDLLETPRQHPEKKFNESVLGTGFWFLGEAAHSPVDIRKDETDRFDNMIDVMSKTFLGVTVSCARCHDHKFDAISTADYYSLHGFLESSDYRQVRFESDLQNKDVADKLAAIDQKHQTKIAEFLRSKGLTPPAPADVLSIEGVVFDYSQSSPDQFFQDGYIFGIQPRQAGTVKLNGIHPEIATRSVAENDLFWQGLTENTLGVTRDVNRLNKLNRSGRTFRTPTFEIDTDGTRPGSLYVKTSGVGTVIACVDSHRLVHGPLHKQTIQKIKPGKMWLRLDLERYLGHRVHLEFVPKVGKQLAVQLVVQGIDKTDLNAVNAQLAELDQPFVEFAEQASQALGIEPARKAGAKASPNLSPLIQQWVAARAELSDQIRLQSNLAPAMMDGSGEDGFVLLRGSSDSPKGLEPRHFLTAISSDAPMEIAAGSGRLELAEAINAADNPLTHRVIANRVWHYLMGRGIVPTTDDFGVLGQRPTNLPLLDHLANRFLAGDRDLKKIIKYIVLSQTYQLSSKPNSEAQAQDPKNLLWHHRPPKRLEGEAIRDALLTVSGELDRTLFGPAVPIHLTSFMTGRGKPKKSGPLDGLARRSIYVSVRRNFLSPFMLAFDTPVPFSTMGRRNISNVPAQALILMNDPLVGQQAEQWAKRALAECETPTERVHWMYIAAFARPATQPELDVALDFVTDQSDLQTWADYAHALINTKEFIFLP